MVRKAEAELASRTVWFFCRENVQNVRHFETQRNALSMLSDTEHATSNTSVQDAFFSTSRPVIIPNFFLNEKRSRSCGVLHGCEKPGSEAMLFSEKQSAVCGSDQSSRS